MQGSSAGSGGLSAVSYTHLVTISFDQEKLKAVQFYAGKTGTSLESDLDEFMEKLYKSCLLYTSARYLRLGEQPEPESRIVHLNPAEQRTIKMCIRDRFITMQVLVIGNIPLLYWLNQDWYGAVSYTHLSG